MKLLKTLNDMNKVY